MQLKALACPRWPVTSATSSNSDNRLSSAYWATGFRVFNVNKAVRSELDRSLMYLRAKARNLPLGKGRRVVSPGRASRQLIMEARHLLRGRSSLRLRAPAALDDDPQHGGGIGRQDKLVSGQCGNLAWLPLAVDFVTVRAKRKPAPHPTKEWSRHRHQFDESPQTGR